MENRQTSETALPLQLCLGFFLRKRQAKCGPVAVGLCPGDILAHCAYTWHVLGQHCAQILTLAHPGQVKPGCTKPSPAHMEREETSQH